MAEETWWVRLRADGTVSEQGPGKKPAGRGWHRADRRGDLATETWRPGKGWVPRNADALHAAIDAAHDADNGAWRRAIDYAIKQIEARMILGLLATDGLLAREAAMRGVSAEDLARAVLLRADRADTELGRVAAIEALLTKAP